MPEIILVTNINAPIQRCFDLARSIDFHISTSAETGEKAVLGRTSGLICKGERVTWLARHFGIEQTLTSEIPEMEIPFMFEDRMVKGAFRSISHIHLFQEADNCTVMKDIFRFETPLGLLGRLFNAIVLTSYMKRFLEERNRRIKEAAESDGWKMYLKQG